MLCPKHGSFIKIILIKFSIFRSLYGLKPYLLPFSLKKLSSRAKTELEITLPSYIFLRFPNQSKVIIYVEFKKNYARSRAGFQYLWGGFKVRTVFFQNFPTGITLYPKPAPVVFKNAIAKFYTPVLRRTRWSSTFKFEKFEVFVRGEFDSEQMFLLEFEIPVFPTFFKNIF